ncbi:MAG: DUF2029 domain-containing protein [Anaerolineales bacterium]|nr:DUF2029 domain-containing protein [Anaerolineales bacterium]
MNKKVFLAIILLGLIIGIFLPFAAPGMGEADFLSYWSSSRLLVTGEDPYNQFALSALQQSTRPDRFAEQGLVISTWNLPWLMLIFAPLGLLPFDLAVSAWIFVSIALVGFSLSFAWDEATSEYDERGFLFILALGLVYIHTLVMVVLGQITSLVLFGVLGSIWLMRKKHYWLAGACLLLTTVKPHLSFFFLAIVFVWAVRNRHWKILLSLAGFAMLSMLAVWLIFPGWLTSYINLMTHLPYREIDTSTLGSFLLARFNIPYLRFVGVLLLPLAFPLAPLADRHGWLTASNLALLLTLPLAPYGFGVDQILVLPAFVQIAAWINNRSLAGWEAWFAGAVPILINVILVFIIPRNTPNHDLFWVPLTVLLVFILAWSRVRAQAKGSQ